MNYTQPLATEKFRCQIYSTNQNWLCSYWNEAWGIMGIHWLKVPNIIFNRCLGIYHPYTTNPTEHCPACSASIHITSTPLRPTSKWSNARWSSARWPQWCSIYDRDILQYPDLTGPNAGPIPRTLPDSPADGAWVRWTLIGPVRRSWGGVGYPCHIYYLYLYHYHPFISAVPFLLPT